MPGPVLTAVAAMREHGMTRAEVDAERLLGRNVSRNRAFDTALLATVDDAAGGPMHEGARPGVGRSGHRLSPPAPNRLC